MRNRGIARGRLFVGTLLLVAAVLTWGIVLMMSPHGQTAAKGTEYVRTTIVTFKRNGAIGTLVLCALAAWLLFPARRPKWPVRDWCLTIILVLLAGTSIYTLMGLPRVADPTGKVDENLAIMNVDANARAAMPEMIPATVRPPPHPINELVVPRGTVAAPAELTHEPPADASEQSAELNVAEEPSNSEGSANATGDEPANNASGENEAGNTWR